MRILRRKKGKRAYYYLQHSFRDGGKVVTKEKYLGKEVPQDIEGVKSAFLENCCKAGLLRSFENVSRSFRLEWQKYPESMKEKSKEQIAIAFTYNTNAIEGSKITLPETRELLENEIAPNKPLRDIKETEAHAKVFLEMLKKKDDFSIGLVLAWHKELFQNTKPDIAGKFREYRVSVGNYVAPDWQDVWPLMDSLALRHNENKNMNPVELAARSHYKFEKIHPFGDGNGRVGRLMMNYILWHSGYPMLIIEYKKRKAYYRALEGTEDEFFRYFARIYLKIHKMYAPRPHG